MTTKEAFEELKRRFPGRKSRAHHWFDTFGGEVFYVEVDDCVSCSGGSFPEVIARLNVLSTAEVAAKIRAEAQAKIAEAERLEKQAAELEVK